MRRLVQSQISGRREGDTQEIWKYDWKKIATLAVTAIAIPWITWMTVNGFKARENEKTLDLQVTVLHNRITDVDHRHVADDKEIRMWMTDKILDLQRDIYQKGK